jgi:hypothetical protein
MEYIQGSNNQEQLNDQGLIKEKIIEATGGCKIIGFFILSIVIQVVILLFMINSRVKKEILVGMLPFLVFFDFIAFILIIKGTFTNEINEAHIITFFGKYYGTVKNNGFLWINPFTSKSKMSLKARNLNGAVIKVNDKHGNPVMMGCVVVWRIYDTAKASFEVASCEEYIRIQSEGVVREVGCLFPYDKLSQEDTITLKGDQKEINRILVDLMSKRCMAAGIQIIEAKITELSYANEIAEVMLKTQAADAVIAARDKIVNGAVSMIGHALSSLDSNEICKMSREKKAKLVSNMLVVLCGESQNTSNVSSSASRLTEGIYKYR